MLRVSRQRRGPDPTLGYRMLLFALGAAAGLIGMATNRSLLIFLGTVFLALGLFIAIRQGRKDRLEAEAAQNEDDPDPAA